MLQAAGINLQKPFVLPRARAANIITKVVAQITSRLQAWIAARTPHPGKLADAVALADGVKAPGAQFLGWRRLPQGRGTMEARWSDGTVAYQRRGRIWLY
jgi:hypothetical protein